MNKGEITFSVRTFGCQMNVNDTEKVEGMFTARGWRQVDDSTAADVVFVNTCAVRSRAEQKLYGLLDRIAWSQAGRRSSQVVAVGGCVAQLEGTRLLDRAKGVVDILVGPRSLHRLPELVESGLHQPASAPAVALDSLGQDAFQAPVATARSDRKRALVTAMEGCNQVCSFCVVPQTRGTEICRDPDEIVNEVRQRVDTGAAEVVLLGQTVNAYRHGDSDFAAILARCASVPGLRRLRFATSHPNHLTERLVVTMAEHPTISPHLHLPVQSGSTSVLATMRRGYDRAGYQEKIALVRRLAPAVSLWSDVIVGYPGETDQDFRDTIDLIETVRFAGLFAFTYSPRPGTVAFRRQDDVPERQKRERLAEVNRHQQAIQLTDNLARVGRRESVLVDLVGRGGRLEGRAADNRIVHCDGPASLVGSFIDVEITGAGPNALLGRRILEGPATS